MKYHTKGIGKNKKIREERKKPLPIGLMRNEEIDRYGIHRRGSEENIGDCKGIQGTKNDGHGYK